MLTKMQYLLRSDSMVPFMHGAVNAASRMQCNMQCAMFVVSGLPLYLLWWLAVSGLVIFIFLAALVCILVSGSRRGSADL